MLTSCRGRTLRITSSRQMCSTLQRSAAVRSSTVVLQCTESERGDAYAYAL
jgi:hypothetical protein